MASVLADSDVLALLVSASISGIDPQPFVARHPLLRGQQPEQIDLFLTVHAGFLIRLATLVGHRPMRTWPGWYRNPGAGVTGLAAAPADRTSPDLSRS